MAQVKNLISVIIPVRNGENYLADAINGIKKQNMNVEIIVVDDASTDNTYKLAQDLGCIVVSHSECKGQVAAKNTGLNAVNGDFIMFHDHDDIMNDGALIRLHNELSENPQYAAVMAKVQDFYSPELSDEDRNNTVIKSEPYFGLFTGAVLMKKSIFEIIGPFTEALNTGEIIEWQNKLLNNKLEIKKIDFVSTKRRVHLTNYGQTHKMKEFSDYAKVLRSKLGKSNGSYVNK